LYQTFFVSDFDRGGKREKMLANLQCGTRILGDDPAVLSGIKALKAPLNDCHA
jgi:hypothetical protein